MSRIADVLGFGSACHLRSWIFPRREPTAKRLALGTNGPIRTVSGPLATTAKSFVRGSSGSDLVSGLGGMLSWRLRAAALDMPSIRVHSGKVKTGYPRKRYAVRELETGERATDAYDWLERELAEIDQMISAVLESSKAWRSPSS